MSDCGKQYCLKWNNFSDNILNSLESLRGDEDFVDVTIACEGHSLKAHKVVLSACSLYIKKLLKENPCAHPIIILKDVALAELRALLSFMYNGQVMVEEDQIPRLLRTAELLEIRGLADLTGLNEQPVNRGLGTDNQSPEHGATPPPAKRVCAEEAQVWASAGPDSEEDEEYEDEDEDEEEEEGAEQAALPDFQLPEVKPPRDLQVTTLDPAHFASSRPPVPSSHAKSMEPVSHSLHTAQGEAQDIPPPTRAMMPLPGHRAVDIAARVSQMEDNLLPGDVLVIGETHITPARCVPRPLKPPPLEPPPKPCFGNDVQAGEGRLTLEMSLRLQVQRKLEAERLRAMERLRHAEAAAFNEGVMNTPMDCSSYPVLTNGVHPVENGNHRDDGLPPLTNQPPAPPNPAAGPPTIPLPLSPDLQLKMLMCRDFKKYTNMLLVAVFGREVLATHCLNGSKGSAKPRLDTDKVTRVIATVMEKFDVPASTVREAIRVKLNNEDKLKKRSKRSANPLL